MYRKISKDLEKWKTGKHRKPLILQGARQAGKTYSILEFGRKNYVQVQLSINGYRTYYWESEREAEIDFIIKRKDKIIPIEVKSADNTRAKSLKVYMETYNPEYAVKLSSKNFGFENKKKIVPLYAAFCI
ncbi:MULTISPECIES: DUF4143 domain-containing protein [unclassified Treponema]|uniref:DUF4143 domain-containing protein n=1 Tax=unclassified Treponema TaxID=2638727 RepID=UPI0020A5A672|nr:MULTISPECIES: DUF4143 domain-containing protein [unclassified Treponema]